MDNKATKSDGKRFTVYLLLNLYLAMIVGVMAYLIHIGPKGDQPVGIFMTGLTSGVSFMMVVHELNALSLFKAQRCT